ncbi:MAG: PQQ-binding-like beta-propeller repeat protein [Anaerolineae bacterium]|nr:PQQ-binding-like beta-propeller repeat protein [Anaerolineae bacterium]
MKKVGYRKKYALVILAFFGLYMMSGGKVNANKCTHWSSSQPTDVIQQSIGTISTRFEPIEEHHISLRDMSIREETAFVMGNNVDDISKLFSLNVTTGQLNWQICASGVMAVGADFVFVSYDEIRGAYVIAYDRNSGAEVWQAKVDFWRGVTILDVTPFGLLVQTANRNSERYYLLNMETGEQETSFKTEADRQSFWIENGSTVYRVPSYNEVIAQGGAEWQTRVDYDSSVYSEPTELILDDVVVAYKRGYPVTQIAALDKSSGGVLWQASLDIQSNIGIANDVVFFVTGHSELTAVNLQTGQFLGSVIFTPGAYEVAGRNTDILVAADGDLVAVYFSGSSQLFVFRFR